VSYGDEPAIETDDLREKPERKPEKGQQTVKHRLELLEAATERVAKSCYQTTRSRPKRGMCAPR
jgi:hypothetical protein